MKRIKITEGQAKRLKLISENTDPLSSYEHFCKIKAQEVNRLYTRIINITIAEIISNEVNIDKLNEMLNKIESEVRIGSRRAYQYIKNMPEADLDLRIDNAEDMVTDKLTPLQLLTMDLEKLQNSIQESRLTKSFNDINPLDITGLQK
jgi:hypothetical protein